MTIENIQKVFYDNSTIIIIVFCIAYYFLVKIVYTKLRFSRGDINFLIYNEILDIISKKNYKKIADVIIQFSKNIKFNVSNTFENTDLTSYLHLLKKINEQNTDFQNELSKEIVKIHIQEYEMGRLKKENIQIILNNYNHFTEEQKKQLINTIYKGFGTTYNDFK